MADEWKNVGIELDSPLADRLMQMRLMDIAAMMGVVMDSSDIDDERERELLEMCTQTTNDACEAVYQRIETKGEFLIVLGQTIVNLFFTFANTYQTNIYMSQLERDLERLGEM